ncbi:MAG: hypothetical protein WCQ60_01295 [bacterium]
MKTTNNDLIKLGKGKIPDGYHLIDAMSLHEFLGQTFKSEPAPGMKVRTWALEKFHNLQAMTQGQACLVKTENGVMNISDPEFKIVPGDTDVSVIVRDDFGWLNFVGLWPPHDMFIDDPIPHGHL